MKLLKSILTCLLIVGMFQNLLAQTPGSPYFVPINTIGTINCSGATNNGTLTQSVAASGVSSVISYTGGNGGAHTGQTVTSTGVTGLTATLTAGSFATGAGSLTYTITGTPTTGGIASFAIAIGGQTCTLTRFVNVPVGTGTLAGKTCFDIALSNDNASGCGPLSARTATQANFTQVATHTQTYTFTPSGTVSNVRFMYYNTNGSPIIAISGGNAGNNISTAQTCTVNYSTSLNTTALGLTSTAALTGDIYVIFNDGPTNNGVDQQIKLTAQVKDCTCCGAFVAAGVYKDFMCHNLGATTSLDPNVPVQGIHGNYYQWGRSTVVADASTPVGAITGWNGADAPNGAWLDTSKTANDPCPSGFRVPTNSQLTGVIANNTVSRTGSWTDSATNFTTAIHWGPNASTKTLTLPAGGYRSFGNGSLSGRGGNGFYWTSTMSGSTSSYYLVVYDLGAATIANQRPNGFSVRCIAE